MKANQQDNSSVLPCQFSTFGSRGSQWEDYSVRLLDFQRTVSNKAQRFFKYQSKQVYERHWSLFDTLKELRYRTRVMFRSSDLCNIHLNTLALLQSSEEMQSDRLGTFTTWTNAPTKKKWNKFLIQTTRSKFTFISCTPVGRSTGFFSFKPS